MRYIVGLKLRARHDHMIVCAEDALVAALKVKAQCPDALITYVRRQNKRGDARHPTEELQAAGAAV